MADPKEPVKRKLPTAAEIAEIMAANMRENKKDPDFLAKRALRDAEITRKVLADHGLDADGRARDAAARTEAPATPTPPPEK